MNTVSLKMTDRQKVGATVYIDGNEVVFKTSALRGSKTATYETDRSEVELRIVRYLEINSSLWFLMSILFFIIGLFGIFDPRYDKKCIAIDYTARLKLSEQTNVGISFNTMTQSGQAVMIDTDNKCEETVNEYFVDNIAKRRLKFMRFIKIVLLIATVVGAAMILYLLID